MKAMELTDISWLLIDDHETYQGILIRRADKYEILSKEIHEFYEDYDKVVEKYGKIKFKKRPTNKTELFLAGYPVDVDEAFQIDEEGLSYTKTENSKIKFAPGYWGLLFSNCYVAAFCPKYSTINKYESLGPFKDRLIMQSELLMANKKLNDDL